MPWDSCTVNGTVATFNCIVPLFTNVITWLFELSGTVALFLIIFSGIKFITSGGDAKQVEGARKTLTYAVIGLLVIFFSYLIINLISTITGVGCIKVFGFDSCGSTQSSTQNFGGH